MSSDDTAVAVSMSEMMGGGMYVYFNNEYLGGKLIFAGWNLDNHAAFAGTIIAVFVFAFLYEFFHFLSDRLDFIFLTQWNNFRAANQTEILVRSSPKLRFQVKKSFSQFLLAELFSFDNSIPLAYRVFRSFFYAFRLFFSLCLMIVFMTMNYSFILAMMAGYGLGFFLFAKHKFINKKSSNQIRFDDQKVSMPNNAKSIQQQAQCCVVNSEEEEADEKKSANGPATHPQQVQDKQTVDVTENEHEVVMHL